MMRVKNLYWAESGDLVAIASETLFYILKHNCEGCEWKGVEDAFELWHVVGDCLSYNNFACRLNCYVGGEVLPHFMESQCMLKKASKVAIEAIQINRLTVAKEVCQYVNDCDKTNCPLWRLSETCKWTKRNQPFKYGDFHDLV